MKFCGNCGQQLDDNAIYCTNCNTIIGGEAAPQAPAQPVQQPAQPVQETVQQQQPVYIPNPSTAPYGAAPAPANDDPYPINVTHKGFWSLGFFFGVVGLILYFVMKNSKPRLAKSALKGFIAGLILYGVVIGIYVIIAIIGALAMM